MKTSEQREIVGTTGRKQSVNRQEQTTSNIDSNIKYEVTSHNQHNRYQIKPYMIKHTNVQLFSVVTFFPLFSFKMKKRKGNRIKKYMVLFCIVLVSVVVSTVLAGYVGSKSVEKDIPNETSPQLQKITEREFLEMLYSNLTEIKSALQFGKNHDSGNFNVKNYRHSRD